MPTATGYTLTASTSASFADAVEHVRAELKEEGFGVLCEIDVQATLREKLGAETDPYLILGACNPPLAHQALSAEAEIGTHPLQRRRLRARRADPHRRDRCRADALDRRQRGARPGRRAGAREARRRRRARRRLRHRRLHLTNRHLSIYLQTSIRVRCMMWKLFERTGRLAITFCERCGQVCDAGCRRAALRERTVLQQLRLGARI